ncbi:MAG: hypothetical protein ACLPVF_01960 [Acidimicrobiales bacterium]
MVLDRPPQSLAETIVPEAVPPVPVWPGTGLPGSARGRDVRPYRDDRCVVTVDSGRPVKEITMSQNAKTDAEENRNEATADHGVIESISRSLDERRGQIDELLVQLDLAKLDVREEVDRQLDVAQNAYLAARSKLADARVDLNATVNAVRQSLEQLLHDLGQACTEVNDAVKRGA